PQLAFSSSAADVGRTAAAATFLFPKMSLRARQTPSKQASVSDIAPAATTAGSSTSNDEKSPGTPKSQPPPPLPPSLSQQRPVRLRHPAPHPPPPPPPGHLLLPRLLHRQLQSLGRTSLLRLRDAQRDVGFDSQAAANASGSRIPDLSKYRLGFIDVVHAVLSVLVFVAVALRDKNVQSCFYPRPAMRLGRFWT
ncbi:hypothetical protein C3L33_21260, partial [Rhododendron williamsianum]